MTYIRILAICLIFSPINAFAQTTNPWQLIPSGTSDNLRCINFVDEQNGWISGEEGVLLRTRDRGQTWTVDSIGVQYNLLKIVALDTLNLWMISPIFPTGQNEPGTFLLKSQDGGNSWSEIWFPDQLFKGIDFIDTTTGWIGGVSGLLLGTTDGGNTWTEANFEPGGTSGFIIEHIEFLSDQLIFCNGRTV